MKKGDFDMSCRILGLGYFDMYEAMNCVKAVFKYK